MCGNLAKLRHLPIPPKTTFARNRLVGPSIMGARPGISDVAYHAVTNPHRPHVDSVGALFPQTLCCRQKVVRDGPTLAVDVYCDELPVVVRLDL